MSDLKFKPGDVVQLKSGGPKMTVSNIDSESGSGTTAWCQWFVDKKFVNGSFAAESLRSEQEKDEGESLIP